MSYAQLNSLYGSGYSCWSVKINMHLGGNKNRKKKFTLENVMCLLIAQAIMGVLNNSKENNRNASVREESALILASCR